MDSTSSPQSRTARSSAEWPRITVVTPSYNQAPYLERTITSVLNQAYPNLEYFVYDAESKDGSSDIIHRFADRLNYHEIAKDRGQTDAINKGWRRATGDVLCWLNSDDYFYPEALTTAGEVFRDNPQIIMLCGGVAIVDVDEHLLREKKPPQITVEQLLPWGGVPGQAAVFLRREVFETIGGPRLDLHYVLDWEMWLRVILHYGTDRVLRMNKMLAGAREWPQAKTESAAGRDAEEVRKVLGEIFSDSKYASLQNMKSFAYARTWWRQSQSEANAGLRSQAWKSLMNAARLAPTAFSISKYMRQIWKIASA